MNFAFNFSELRRVFVLGPGGWLLMIDRLHVRRGNSAGFQFGFSQGFVDATHKSFLQFVKGLVFALI